MKDPTKSFLDYDRLDSMKEMLGNEAYLVIDRFAEGLPDKIGRMPAIMEESGLTALRAEIHRLRGTAVTCGFSGLGAMLAACGPMEVPDFRQLDACARESIGAWRLFRNAESA